VLLADAVKRYTIAGILTPSRLTFLVQQLQSSFMHLSVQQGIRIQITMSSKQHGGRGLYQRNEFMDTPLQDLDDYGTSSHCSIVVTQPTRLLQQFVRFLGEGSALH